MGGFSLFPPARFGIHSNSASSTNKNVISNNNNAISLCTYQQPIRRYNSKPSSPFNSTSIPRQSVQSIQEEDDLLIRFSRAKEKMYEVKQLSEQVVSGDTEKANHIREKQLKLDMLEFKVNLVRVLAGKSKAENQHPSNNTGN